METFLMYVLFAVSFVLIVKGGDWFVDGASWLAEVTGIPRFVVGATVVSFATTLPEVIVSLVAAIEGQQAFLQGTAEALAVSQEKISMAIGNGIGSVICNTAMIMAIGIMFVPTKVDRRRFSPKAILLIVALLAVIILSRNGLLSSKSAIMLLIIFAVYIAENVRSSKHDFLDEEFAADFDESHPKDKKTFLRNILSILVGAAFLTVGSKLLVDYGGEIARSWGVSESVIAVTVVTVGTSLPELITAVVAVVKKQPSMSVGNIIGANIIDSAFILPMCSFIYGGTLPVSDQNIYLDFPVCILASLIALVPAIFTKKFHRWQGVILLLLYAAYIVVVTVKLDWYIALFK